MNLFIAAFLANLAICIQFSCSHSVQFATTSLPWPCLYPLTMQNPLPYLTAPSTTMPKELPEMDTGKEVHVQDGEEHVAFNSMATSGEESEEGMRPAAIEAAAGESYLHPLVLEENESDSEDQIWINHRSSSPEGSLLHAVYFQLLGAGFDGMAVRELFRSRVHTWRKAFETAFETRFEKPVAALAEPEMEFEEIMHRQNMGDMQMPSLVGNRDDETNGEQLQQQIPQQMRESVRNRHHVAAKKTAAIVGSSEFQGLNWARTTRRLPPHIGLRRKTPAKKKKGYLKNRLQ